MRHTFDEQQLFDEISAETTDFTCVLWDLENEPEGCAREDVDIAVAPYYSGRWLKDPSAELFQREISKAATAAAQKSLNP